MSDADCTPGREPRSVAANIRYNHLPYLPIVTKPEHNPYTGIQTVIRIAAEI